MRDPDPKKVVSQEAAEQFGSLIAPYGGELKDLVIRGREAENIRDYARSLPSVRLTMRGECDLELLATGAFSPLDRFMTQADYRSVIDSMRLASGHVFPVPVTLPIGDVHIKLGSDVALCDRTNNQLAVMSVDEIYQWDKAEFASQVLGTNSVRHPLAKTRRLYFEPDTERKQTEATETAREAAKLVQPFYDKLEAVRREREEYAR